MIVTFQCAPVPVVLTVASSKEWAREDETQATLRTSIAHLLAQMMVGVEVGEPA